MLAPPHEQCPEYRSKRMSCCPRCRHPYLHVQRPAGCVGDEDAVASSKPAEQELPAAELSSFAGKPEVVKAQGAKQQTAAEAAACG